MYAYIKLELFQKWDLLFTHKYNYQYLDSSQIRKMNVVCKTTLFVLKFYLLILNINKIFISQFKRGAILKCIHFYHYEYKG
ncbi:hypothetical protein DK846_13370 [Methanospirillum lacunae]|uniref:Uncharacterized protein n=1 Tax=Methanospirillum lacunae TaxID=668570 RepID=A0A2V2N002_9EURY|nr:hypothetical protein DK846_13370 [Methanospirillum lacunae]